MRAKLLIAVFLAVFVVESVNCDFNEADFEAKRKEKNIFVLFVKDM